MSWIYRLRTGWAIGRFAFGYERRDYLLTLPLAWPTVWIERKPKSLAPAPKLDTEAFEKRRRETTGPEWT